jgi:DNA-binding transcriptional ArsR family regulator
MTKEHSESVKSVSNQIKCFTHPVKAGILSFISAPKSGNEIESLLDLKQSVGSQFRSDLRKYRLVKTKQAGKYIFYEADSNAIARLVVFTQTLSKSASGNGYAMERTKEILRALNHPIRQKMLVDINKKDWSVCQTDLVNQFGLAQPAAADQIAILVEAGFISEKKEGRNVFYAVNDNELTRCLSIILKYYKTWN